MPRLTKTEMEQARKDYCGEENWSAEELLNEQSAEEILNELSDEKALFWNKYKLELKGYLDGEYTNFAVTKTAYDSVWEVITKNFKLDELKQVLDVGIIKFQVENIKGLDIVLSRKK